MVTTELWNEMGPPENHANSRGVEVEVKTDPGKPQTQHHRINPDFAPRPNFSGECGALTDQTFSSNRTD